jgi:hypothetical protein
LFRKYSILTYLPVFIILLIIVKLIGVIDFSYLEISGYALVFYGMGTVYVSMGNNKRSMLFIGSVAFLVGVILFITSNYDFVKLTNIVLPSIFFILGTAFLILFIDDGVNKLFLIISAIFFVSAIFFFTKLANFNVGDFIKSALSITVRYWIIVVILTAIILLLKKNSRG